MIWMNTNFLEYAFEILSSNNLNFQKQSQSLLKCKKYILILPCTVYLYFLSQKLITAYGQVHNS